MKFFEHRICTETCELTMKMIKDSSLDQNKLHIDILAALSWMYRLIQVCYNAGEVEYKLVLLWQKPGCLHTKFFVQNTLSQQLLHIICII